MARSFADTMKAMSGYFPESLISPSEFEKLSSIGSVFPSLISMGAAFETRLQEEQPFADMFFAIDPPNKSILSGQHHDLKLDKKLWTSPVWQQIRQFFAAWCILGSSFDQNVEKVFLEYDVARALEPIPIPAVFMQISENIYQDKSKTLVPDIDWIFEALQILKSGPISPETEANARLCFQELLPGSPIDHAAIMASRSPDIMRINVAKLSEEGLYRYLDAIGLGGRITQIQPLLSEFSTVMDHYVLALDVSDSFSPRIGIELRLSRDDILREDQLKWGPVLDRLIELGMCCKPKRDGLMEWSGRSRELFDPELYRFLIYRYINHVKLVFEPEKSPTAKGYFSFMIRKFANS